MRNGLIFAALVALILAGCAKKTAPTAPPASAPAPEAAASTAATVAPLPLPTGQKTSTVTLNALNGSNESGTATITDAVSGPNMHTSTIQVVLSNAPAGVKQPVNLYNGTCPPKTAPSVFLEPAVGGKMSHELGGFGLENLKGLSIAVWSSEDMTKGNYVSCGEIKG